MKIGFRKPSIKKSLKARTTGKVKRQVKKAINPLYGKKGVGFVKNPAKSVKNSIYHKTTFGVSDVAKSITKTSTNKKAPKKQNTTKKNNQYEIMASNDLRIINDCIKLVETTTKPDVFFERLQLLKDTSADLVKLEQYVSFNISPTAALNEVFEKEQEAIYNFIVRYYNSVRTYADTLKTDKGKQNQIQKFYDTLMQYKYVMDERNIKYIEYKYKQPIK